MMTLLQLEMRRHGRECNERQGQLRCSDSQTKQAQCNVATESSGESDGRFRQQHRKPPSPECCLCPKHSKGDIFVRIFLL